MSQDADIAAPDPDRNFSRRVVMAAMATLIIPGCANGRQRRQQRKADRRENPGNPVGGSPADQLTETYRRESGVRDFSVRLYRAGSLLYSRDAGAYGASTQINIASASKWMAGATVMAQSDAGRLSIGAPVGDYVSGLPVAYARLTIVQLLSYTAGLPSLKKFAEFRQPEGISLADSARRAASLPLESSPGTQFDYGGANLQFVGAAVEAVNNERWHTVFARDISQPLGMSHTLWGRMNDRPNPSALISNPVLQAGAWSTADDYGLFLTMLASGGLAGSRRILTPAAMNMLAGLRTAGIPKGFTAPGTEGQGVEYALAHWCERAQPSSSGTACTFESSPGFYGTYPWIDRETGIYGIILQKDRLQRVAEATRRLRNGLISLHA